MRTAMIFGVLVTTLLAATSDRHLAAAEPAAKVDFGEPAPQWLRESESYAAWYGPDQWDMLTQSKVKFITHCPVNREFFDRCHAVGIHCFPYVTFYHGDASQTDLDINIKASPESIEVNADGSFRRSAFWDCEDNKNKYTLCPNTVAGQDAMAARIEQILKLGADGVFLDVVRTREPCFGPKFAKHQHLHEDQNHAYAMMLKRIRELIKRHKPDGALLANSGDPLGIPMEYWKYIDADMLESYICTWISKDRLPDWKTQWHAQGPKLRQLLDAGKQIQALSYLGHTPYGIKEDAFFCFATARLAGFVWCSPEAFVRPESAPLYRLTLGKPLGAETEENGVYWRAFENGLVAVNPARDKPGEIAVKPPIPTTLFYDFFSDVKGDVSPRGRVLDVSKTRKLPVPANSGRVFLYAPPGDNALVTHRPRLTIVTKPGLGAVCIRVDGFDYWTHCGYWGTEYIPGTKFGILPINFDKPGKHVVEVVDIVAHDIKMSTSYNYAAASGQARDPSNPAKPSDGRKFRFHGWTGAVTSTQPRIEIVVADDVQLTATFEETKAASIKIDNSK